MELNQVIDFIKHADPDTKSIIKAELKNPLKRRPIKEVCAEDISKLLEILPHTDDTFKSYRYDTTSVTYVRYIRELANLITHNYVCRPNTRGYPSWQGADDVAPGREEVYKKTFHSLATVIVAMLNASETDYAHGNNP